MGVVQELRVSVTTFSTYHRGMTTNNSCSPGSSWFWSVLPRGVCYTGSGSTGSSDHLSSDRILVGSTRTKLVTVRDRRRFESGGTTNISNQNQWVYFLTLFFKRLSRLLYTGSTVDSKGTFIKFLRRLYQNHPWYIRG